MTITEMDSRFHNKVMLTVGGCWLWTGTINKFGYGVAHPQGTKSTPASRLSYLLHVGPIPEGYDVEHLCNNGLCVNPYHLEPVTHKENCQRGSFAKRGHVGRKPIWKNGLCSKGHELSIVGIYEYKRRQNMYRECRQCRRDTRRRLRIARRERR